MHKETQDYIAAITTPQIKALDAFDADVIALQRQAPLYAAELSLELLELQQAVMTEPDATWHVPLNNALQRTQFLASRLEKLTAVLQELRQGLKDLREDQATVTQKASAP
ncbi:MAG: hypothetical protein WC700_02125 [Gemmatimonadaceae bacterium]|jgi:hypothetical protein